MSHPLLQVENLSIRFGDNAPAVRGLSFSVDRGETLAVVDSKARGHRGKGGQGKRGNNLHRWLPGRASELSRGSS